MRLFDLSGNISPALRQSSLHHLCILGSFLSSASLAVNHHCTSMPQAKVKPSDIAAEAKRLWIPHVAMNCPQFPAKSESYTDTSILKGAPRTKCDKLRIAVINGDPVDVALDWHDANCKEGSASKSSVAGSTIPVVNMANERRAGGDWESGLIAPEECFCRRSTLAQALMTPMSKSSKTPHYPMRTTGGIYSQSVGM